MADNYYASTVIRYVEKGSYINLGRTSGMQYAYGQWCTDTNVFKFSTKTLGGQSGYLCADAIGEVGDRVFLQHLARTSSGGVNYDSYHTICLEIIEPTTEFDVYYGEVSGKLYISNTKTTQATNKWSSTGVIQAKSTTKEIVVQGDKFYPPKTNGFIYLNKGCPITQVDISKIVIDMHLYIPTGDARTLCIMDSPIVDNRGSTSPGLKCLVTSGYDALEEFPKWTEEDHCVNGVVSSNITQGTYEEVHSAIVSKVTSSPMTHFSTTNNTPWYNMVYPRDGYTDFWLSAHAPDVESEYPSIFGLAPSTGQWYRKVSGTWQEGTLYKKISGEWKVQEG